MRINASVHVWAIAKLKRSLSFQPPPIFAASSMQGQSDQKKREADEIHTMAVRVGPQVDQSILPSSAGSINSTAEESATQGGGRFFCGGVSRALSGFCSQVGLAIGGPGACHLQCVFVNDLSFCPLQWTCVWRSTSKVPFVNFLLDI